MKKCKSEDNYQKLDLSYQLKFDLDRSKIIRPFYYNSFRKIK